MIDQIISAIAAWTVAVISATGYLGVVILMVLAIGVLIVYIITTVWRK